MARESSHVVAWESSHVEAWESSHVEARGSSHVVARGSSHVVAWGSSHVEAWGSSHVEARESSHVEARGSSHVEAGQWASVLPGNGRYDEPLITGGVLLERPLLDNADIWLEYHGVPVVDGIATLFKAVDDDYRSTHGFAYTPGTTPSAPDWDGGAAECGGGLHFCPSAAAAKTFDYSATKYVACPVRVADIVVHHPALYPGKIKAPGCAGPVYEVDITGKAIEAPALSP